MTTVSILDTEAVPAGDSVVAFAPPDMISLRVDDNVVERRFSELSLSNYAEIWCGDAHCFVVGLKGSEVLLVDLASSDIRPLGKLSRLDLSGRYDPGGMERVSFHDIGDGTILVEHERGIARVSPVDGVRWEYLHDDLTGRVESLNPERIVLVAEDWTRFVSTTDGRLLDAD